jgi:Protein of unknown function (DUF3563)
MLTLFKILSSLIHPSAIEARDHEERYLSEAVDMCDLENRMRLLDGDRRSLHFSSR